MHSADSTSDDPTAIGSWSTRRVVVAVLAAMWLAGAAGYLFGVRSSTSGPSAVDIGFVRDMIAHHEQAIAMASAVIGADTDQVVQSTAREVVLLQRWEIGVMDAWLEDWDQPRGDPDRTAMEWMGMASSVEAVPGMQPASEVERLSTRSGAELERRFLTMLRSHHQGGIHMSDYAAQNASIDKVAEFAERIARYQFVEANEYTMLLEQLGLEG